MGPAASARLAIFAGLATLGAAAFGQVVTATQFRLGTTLTVDTTGAVTSCGIRFVGVPEEIPTHRGATFPTIDGSVVFGQGGLFMFKGCLTTSETAALQSGRPPAPTPTRRRPLWLKVNAYPSMGPHDLTASTENPGCYLGLLSGPQAVETLNGLIRGARLMVAFEGEAKARFVAYSGDAILTPTAAQDLTNCLSALTK